MTYYLVNLAGQVWHTLLAAAGWKVAVLVFVLFSMVAGFAVGLVALWRLLQQFVNGYIARQQAEIVVLREAYLREAAARDADIAKQRQDWKEALERNVAFQEKSIGAFQSITAACAAGFSHLEEMRRDLAKIEGHIEGAK